MCSDSGYSMRYNQRVLTRFESVYIGEIEFNTFVGPAFRRKSGNYPLHDQLSSLKVARLSVVGSMTYALTTIH